jgi:acyl-coenzyme A thioesterase PaaI-like protein
LTREKKKKKKRQGMSGNLIGTQFSSFVRSRLEQGLSARFLNELGIKAAFIDKGHTEFKVKIEPKHHQHHGFVHAGVITTLADHAAGCAAMTVTKEFLFCFVLFLFCFVFKHQHHILTIPHSNYDVLTAEFKVNFLRPAAATHLYCVSRVLKPGRLVVAESWVYGLQSDPTEGHLAGAAPMARMKDMIDSNLVAKATITLMALEARRF